MKNPRITKKELGLIKGSIRRVFSRSDLRKLAVDATRVEHHDPERPRVKKWSKCSDCKNLTPTYQIQVDHINPIIPVNTSLQDMTWDDIINNVWCDIDNLQGICLSCHTTKSKLENKARRANKKDKSKK